MAVASRLSTFLQLAKSPLDSCFDGLILITHSTKQLDLYSSLKGLSKPVSDYLMINENAKKSANLIQIDKSIVPSGRLVISGTGPVVRDQDDVRRFHKAARDGMKMALGAGMKSPVVVTVPHEKYRMAELVSVLGALHEVYVPLNVREEENKKKLDSLGIFGVEANGKELVSLAEVFDEAFTVCRDIGDSDPQRMAPCRVAEYVKNVFANGCVKVKVISDEAKIEAEYPLMAAVNRAASGIELHKPRFISLEYTPEEGSVEKTYMLVGKGVTIDTGGANIKIDSGMLGMSRDKYGSAVVAGFFKALDKIRPKSIKVIGSMCMVRNSVGSNAYTCDEILKSRSGKRIAVYNTDAEGRLIMLDALTEMKEKAPGEVNPHLMTLATLTGHEYATYGYYAAAMDNGPARADRLSQHLQDVGDAYGQPVELSRLQGEDYTTYEAESDSADYRQAFQRVGKGARGHQGAAAFLIQASGLSDNGADSNVPIKYTHIDIGGAMGEFPHVTYPNPLVSLIAGLVLEPHH